MNRYELLPLKITFVYKMGSVIYIYNPRFQAPPKRFKSFLSSMSTYVSTTHSNIA